MQQKKKEKQRVYFTQMIFINADRHLDATLPTDSLLAFNFFPTISTQYPTPTVYFQFSNPVT